MNLHRKIKSIILVPTLASGLFISCVSQQECDTLTVEPVQYATTLMGTLSDYTISTGNTYPATAVPWGMNFWTPQTGKMGDGWTYCYDAHEIRGLKQTHQPSPWINDYGQFSIMPVRDASLVDEDSRASWFSHKAETAKPHYYQVYLADHDINAELTPSDRAAKFRFTFPESAASGVVIDAFDKGSYIKVLKESNTVIGYTTKNSGGVPENFKNWFVVKFDKPIESFTLYDGKSVVMTSDGKSLEPSSEIKGNHAIAVVKFRTVRDEQVNLSVASSFISEKQAYTNLKEVASKDFDTVLNEAKTRWNNVLGKIQIGGGTVDQYRTFYSCLYRSVLFPRKFYEVDENGDILHYSPVRYVRDICTLIPVSGIHSGLFSLF